MLLFWLEYFLLMIPELRIIFSRQLLGHLYHELQSVLVGHDIQPPWLLL
ncbi:hypothetical protein SEEMEL47_08132 [Salmonella enterica subsp. enterica serovar Meleagridis]|nr:hypothetical protein SEEMEL47_08132 [Salmonella enterica subsp. enterica serovar Meleagridis str. 0047]